MAQDTEWDMFAVLVEMQSAVAQRHACEIQALHTDIYPAHTLEDADGPLQTPTLLGRIGVAWTDKQFTADGFLEDGLVTLRIV